MNQPARFAVVGNPIKHSLSPQVHVLFSAQTGIELHYQKLLAPLEDFASVASDFFTQGGQGLNVTAPFKGDAAEWVDELDQSAYLTHSVNTITWQQGLQERVVTKGYSTDGPGLVKDLEDQWGLTLKGLKLLIIGAGGAARGIIPSLLEQGPERLVVVNRTPSRAQDLVEHYQDLSACELSAGSLDARLGNFDLVVNAASGIFESAHPPHISALADALCYDLSYSGERETGFCRQARLAGADDTRGGLGMLVCQAAFSFQIWHGVLPETAPVLRSLQALVEPAKKRGGDERTDNLRADESRHVGRRDT